MKPFILPENEQQAYADEVNRKWWYNKSKPGPRPQFKLVEGHLLRANDGKIYLVVKGIRGRLELLPCDKNPTWIIPHTGRPIPPELVSRSVFPFRWIEPNSFGFKRIA
jgi:hypothetical protein